MNIQHVEVFAGEDHVVTLYARDSSNVTQNIAAREIDFLMGRPPNDIDSRRSIFSKDGTIVDASAGEFSVAIEPDDTKKLRSGDYEYTALATDTGRLTFVNTDGDALQFVNDAGFDLYFVNQNAGSKQVVTTGRFRIQARIG